MMTLQELLTHFPNARKVGKSWLTNCTNPDHPDIHPSLSIYEDEKGPHLKCMSRNCSDEAILSGANLTPSDVWSNNGNGHNAPPPQVPRINLAWLLKNWTLVDQYAYKDENDEFLYEVMRFHDPAGKEKKEFRPWYKKDADGRRIEGFNNKQTLYYLQNVISCVRTGETIYIVEGEKDVNNAYAKLRITATCGPGGAGGGMKWWRDGRYSEHLRGARVVIIPDNDKSGRDLVQTIAKSLHGIAQEVKVLDLAKEAESGRHAGLPVLPEKGDLSDWIELGGDAETLKNLATWAPIWTPEDDGLNVSNETLPTEDFRQTDAGNAERLINTHGDNLRFNVDSGKWLIWTGKLWKPDLTFEVNRLALGVVRSMYAELATIFDKRDRDDMFAFIKRSESEPRLNAMVSLARKVKGIAVQSKDLNADKWLLNCENGTLDLRSGRLREHRQGDLITKLVPVEYDSEATCPRWEMFLQEVFQDPDSNDKTSLNANEEIISFLQRAIGHTLTGDTSEQCFFMLHGNGSNGKSTMLTVFREILIDYHEGVPTSTLLESKGGRGSDATPDIAPLCGARMVSAIETRPDKGLAEALLKALTGGDPITARYLYREFFQFVPEFKLWLACNHLPIIEGQDYAIWRRIFLIPFNVTFREKESPDDNGGPFKDKDLPTKLRMEYPGILRWMVEGCREWQEAGLGTAQAIKDAIKEYKTDMDVMGEFFEARCIIDPKAEAGASELYAAYRKWAEEQGVKKPMSNTKFGRKLKERGEFRREHKSTGKVWHGLKLKPVTDDAQNDDPPRSNDGFDGFDGISGKKPHENPSREGLSQKGVKPVKPVMNDDGSADSLLQWGQRNGWPELEISSGHKITSGEEAWRRFIANASQDRKDAAYRAVCAVDGQVTK